MAARTTKTRSDPVVTALRRLLTATDRSLAAANQLRQARIALVKVVDGKK